VLAAYDRGKQIKEIADSLGVSGRANHARGSLNPPQKAPLCLTRCFRVANFLLKLFFSLSLSPSGSSDT